jgi:MFS family permease
MLTSPVFGAFADRGRRTVLIAVGVAVWSLATAAAAGAVGFYSLLAARAAVGVGEAAYAVISPSLIADFFSPDKRNRILTIFYIATPVGSALGFVLGGMIGESYGWRAAFLVCGLPGLLIAALALLIKEPPRGSQDLGATAKPSVGWLEALRTLKSNRVYVYTVAGYVAVSFATGGIADWFATFLVRERGMGVAEAATWTGVSAVVGGIAGTVMGGLLADRLKGVTKNPYLATSGVAMVVAALLSLLALYVFDGSTRIVLAVTGCQVFLWMYNGPVNALIVNSVDASLRARAFGVSIFCIHAFGDAASPPLIGLISDHTNQNLSLALVLVPIFLLIGALVWIAGWRNLPASDTPDGSGSQA